MNKAGVKKLSNSKLIKLLLKQNVESTPKPSMLKPSRVLNGEAERHNNRRYENPKTTKEC